MHVTTVKYLLDRHISGGGTDSTDELPGRQRSPGGAVQISMVGSHVGTIDLPIGRLTDVVAWGARMPNPH